MVKKAKVFVGVSGGVDSSVALALLKNEGYDVTGVFLKVWHPDFLLCDWREERRSAMRVCATLGVPFLTFDFSDEYKKDVVDYMISEYKAGRVPNPDVFCNKYVKFGVFLDKALKMGADYVATGHYAMIESNLVDSGSDEKRVYQLLESADKNKDQSYFLYTLGQHELSHTLFPIGHLQKSEVRKLAKEFGLPTAEKKDSQGLCFIGKIDLRDFLSHFIESKKGDVLNLKGEVVGEHEGSIFYAIGQRHGLNIIKKSPDDPRYFVVTKDIEKNTVTISDKETESTSGFLIKSIFLPEINFINKISSFPLKTMVRIRYRQEKEECVISKKSDGYLVEFQKTQSGISIGQSAVFYNNSMCLGGGIIEKANVQ